MKKIYLINIVILIFLLILLVLFLAFLNKKLSGVPIYDRLKIDRNQLAHIKSKTFKINKKFIPKIQDLKINKHVLIKCGYQESGIYHMVYTPDIYGFRDNHMELYKNTDVVMIGDSFSFSICVNQPYDLKSQLEKVSKKKFLNLSISGSGPKQQTNVIKNFTNETNFDYFIWIFYEGNDFEDLVSEQKKIKQNPNAFEKEQLINAIGATQILKSKNDVFVDYKKLIELQEKFPEKKIVDYKWQNEKLVKIKIFLAEKLRGLNALIKFFRNYNELLPYKEYDNVVNEMNIYLNNKKIKKKFIYYLPKYTRLANKYKKHPEVENLNQIKNLVKLTANKHNFVFIDGADFFHNRNVPLNIFPYKIPTHFNETGYKLLAEHINIFIVK